MPMSPQARTGILAAAIVGGLFLVGCAIVGAAVVLPKLGKSTSTIAADDSSSRPPLFGGPSASREGETWTHKELVAYLRSRGVDVSVGTSFGKSDVYYSGKGYPYLISAHQFPAAREAREWAGSKADPDCFSWGRFGFSGDSDTLRAIKLALGA